MKEGWTYKKLGEVCDLYQPQTITKKEMNSDGLYNVYGANGIIGKYDKYNHELPELLMGCRGSCGLLNFSSAKAWINGNAMVIHIKDEINLNRYFLFYLLSFIDKKDIIKGVAQPQITRQTLAPLMISFPSVEEQQRIVSRLDSAFSQIDELKANAEKQLSEAKALFQKALAEEMKPKEGWEEKNLGEMSEIQSGFAFKSTQFQKRGEFQVIRMGNVRPGIIRYNESPVFIDSVDKNTIEKALLKVGDMIITQTGSRNKRDYGFTVLIDKEKLLLNQRIARIRVINTITNKYLLYYSWTDYFRDQYFANEGGTVGQGNVGIDAIRYAVIPYPPFSEQQAIVTRLDTLSSQVRNLEENCRKTLAECDALKQAMLREVFE